MTYTLEQKNSAITSFLGGPEFLKKNYFPEGFPEEHITLEDLRYHLDWNWIIPCWAKVRTKLPFAMVVPAISAIDIADIGALHEILANVCINWCNEQGIKL